MTAARNLLLGDVDVLSRWRLADNTQGPDYRDLIVKLPLRTVSETNQREHWAKRHRRRRQLRQTVNLCLGGVLRAEGFSAPCHVVLTRCAPSAGLDDDNLVSSLKAVRDGVADALGVDDRSSLVTWEYAQCRSKPREWAVEIRIVKGGG